MRKTANTKVVAQTNSRVNAIFDEMTTFIMDIFVLLDIFIDVPSPNEIVVVLCGANHAVNLARFFAKDAEICFKFDKHGNIAEGHSQHEAAFIPAKVPKLLRDLRRTSSNTENVA